MLGILATRTSHLPITPAYPQLHTNHSYIHIYSLCFVPSGFSSKYTTKDSDCLSQNLIPVNNFNANTFPILGRLLIELALCGLSTGNYNWCELMRKPLIRI